MVEVVDVLADPGDDGLAGDRGTVPVIDQQPRQLVVDDAIGGRPGLFADVELMAPSGPLLRALKTSESRMIFSSFS